MGVYDKRLIIKCLTRARYWPRVAKVVASKFLGRTSVIIRADGVDLEGGTKNGQGLWCLVSGLDYDEQLVAWIGKLEPGATVIDVGANIGVYTIRAGMKVGPAGRVLAVEPLPPTIERLKCNIARNGIQNVEVLEFAVSDHDGQTLLYDAGRQSSASFYGSGSCPSYQVEVRTIDTMVSQLQLPRVDWIKIDVECAEPQVLAGMEKTIRRFRPNILFENNAAAGSSIELLRAHGYVIGQYDKSLKWFGTKEGENLFARPIGDALV
jgi:FkbM family methyltransferase